MNTIIGIFDDPMSARRAMERLRDGPLMLEDVSIISKNADVSGANAEDVSAGEGAAVGAVWGGLVGLTALLIPGIGPFVAGGALFAALTGAVTGAVVGGISAALIDFSGIPAEDARGYEQEVNSGKTLVAVKARDEDTAAVHQLLSEDGASSVRDSVHDSATAPATGMGAGAPPRIAMYDSGGRRVEQGATASMGTAATSTAATSTAATNAGTRRYGMYDTPVGTSGSWTRGEVVGEGQGSGPRADTGTYDADQWVGEGQGPGKTPGNTWTSGEVVGEGQGSGPRADTGTYDSRQWVGEGQGDGPPADDSTTKRSS